MAFHSITKGSHDRLFSIQSLFHQHFTWPEINDHNIM